MLFSSTSSHLLSFQKLLSICGIALISASLLFSLILLLLFLCPKYLILLPLYLSALFFLSSTSFSFSLLFLLFFPVFTILISLALASSTFHTHLGILLSSLLLSSNQFQDCNRHTIAYPR